MERIWRGWLMVGLGAGLLGACTPGSKGKQSPASEVVSFCQADVVEAYEKINSEARAADEVLDPSEKKERVDQVLLSCERFKALMATRSCRPQGQKENAIDWNAQTQERICGHAKTKRQWLLAEGGVTSASCTKEQVDGFLSLQREGGAMAKLSGPALRATAARVLNACETYRNQMALHQCRAKVLEAEMTLSKASGDASCDRARAVLDPSFKPAAEEHPLDRIQGVLVLVVRKSALLAKITSHGSIGSMAARGRVVSVEEARKQLNRGETVCMALNLSADPMWTKAKVTGLEWIPKSDSAIPGVSLYLDAGASFGLKCYQSGTRKLTLEGVRRAFKGIIRVDVQDASR